ncbi:gliding motility protein RemB [Mucilaginibacter limnophilus]|uniref:Gliding motility protein RemB n=1 Tax=Mucilaginibacter limnophilus TaxID=1932778 RepID=A0A437MW45_9SPHI|nr:gliding motility protein RemB [Mucilaginibacter limnophilus]RVU01888.1 gliding motility protein RemB [Mucilaginibacter limnophilus]
MKKLFISAVLGLTVFAAKAQSQYQPYSYQFYQKLNSTAYSTQTRVHTALKPYFADDSLLRAAYDSLMNMGNDGDTHSLGYRKLFTEHLIDSRTANNSFYADVLPDVTIGRNFSQFKENTHLFGLGMQLGGTVGDKFSYNVGGFLNTANFPEYLDTYINQVGIVPGQAYNRSGSGQNKDWSYITATVSYTPIKYLNISAGRDKSFVGDGYRSLLLSDYASPAPFFRLVGTLGNVRYMAMWSYMNDPMNPAINNYSADKHKWAIFHYLDWNISNRVSVGFFETVTWANQFDDGTKRGFDFAYINPIIFLRPVEASSGSPDNVILGFNSKWKISNGATLYGQFMLDEFETSNFFSNNGSARNKYGWQLGLRGANLFGVSGLNYLVETNNVTPYTYSQRSPQMNYTGNSEPLAHPWGANFREVVGLLNYSYKRFDFSGEIDYGHYGLDEDGKNYGKDLFENYRDPVRAFGNYTGQGLTTNMIYFEGKVGFLLNPKTNLRIELGGIFRNDTNEQFTSRTAMLTLGIRSSFRSFYSDLASYRAR